MNTHITDDEKAVIDVVKYQPAVSIILPFETLISLKTETDHKLKLIQEKVKRALFAVYPPDKAKPVLEKLQNIVNGLKYDSGKKSIAIFVSPLTEKVFYLDSEVTEKIVIDETFEIRDLIYNKKQAIAYLVLSLSGDTAKIYNVKSKELTSLKFNVPVDIDAYENDLPERVSNFSDPARHKEAVLNKFLHHIDLGLSDLLKEYPLPVFVIGPDRVTGHFKKTSKNEKSIVKYIHGNLADATTTEILATIEPHFMSWQKLKEQQILMQLDKAINEKLLATGMKEVWSAAARKNSRLLIVEKDYTYAAHLGLLPDHIDEEDESLNQPFYIKDAVDDVMVKVLENGGEIEFVENGILSEYGNIALIEYFGE